RPHLVPEVEVSLAEPGPLPHRAGPVGRLVRRHPRIDGVGHGEVLRRAHQVPARTPPALPGDHEARVGVRSTGKHAPTMRVSSESLRKYGLKRRFAAQGAPPAFRPPPAATASWPPRSRPP